MADSKRRRARRKVRENGTVTDVQRALWQGIRDADLILRQSHDDAVRLRAVHAITTAAGVYVKVIEAADFEDRLAALERAVRRGERVPQTVAEALAAGVGSDA